MSIIYALQNNNTQKIRRIDFVETKIAEFVLFVSHQKKQLFIYLVNVYVHNIYGIKLRSSFQAILTIPDVTPQSPILRFTHQY